ncbi:MAG TPA: hypothetical protein ENN81_02105 [Phycisphaerales bacterium]|nr:hypothetical protein [Phycisphaerales bacterium]
MARTGRRVYLWGWYGQENSGDDALLQSMSGMLLDVSEHIEILVQVDRAGRLPSLPPAVKIRRLTRRFKGSITLNRVMTLLGADALVFGGGSIMADANEARLRGLREKYYVCRAAWIIGVPIVFAALGAGPLVTPRGRTLARKILNMADVVEVRDATSYELCRHLEVSTPVIRGFDPAVLMAGRLSMASSARRPDQAGEGALSIGVALSMSPGTVDNSPSFRQKKLANLVGAIRKISGRRRLNLFLIEMCGDDVYGEKALCRSLRHELKGACEITWIPYSPEPVEMLRRISRLDAIIAERLHAAIYAFALGIPFAIVPYHAKCTAFADEVGLPEVCRLDADLSGEGLERLLELCVESPEACRAALPAHRACEMALAGRNAVVERLKTLLGTRTRGI